MKKLLLAAALSAVASTSQADTVYGSDACKVANPPCIMLKDPQHISNLAFLYPADRLIEANELLELHDDATLPAGVWLSVG